MQDVLLELRAKTEMKMNGRYSKKTFRKLLKYANITLSQLCRELEEIKECEFYYDASYLSDILRDKSSRKPSKRLSKYLEIILKDKGIKLSGSRISGKFAMECRQAMKKKMEEDGDGECYDEEYDDDYLENYWVDHIDKTLSDNMLCILHYNIDILCQVNVILWETIEKLEQCAEEQRLKIELEFKGKESRTLKKKEPELKKALTFSWNCTLNDREKVLNEVIDWWKNYDFPLWHSLEVFAKMDERVWKLTKMIILSDYYPQSEDFSPRIRKLLDKYLG